MIRSGLALLLLAGCGQSATNLKYKIGECTYAGNGEDRKSIGTNTNSDGWTGRKTGEARRSDDGIEARSIEEVIGLHRRVDRPNEWERIGHSVGPEQDHRHIQLTIR